MKTRETAKIFLEYFEKKGHTTLPSSSLIPQADPTLLFTNAGMVQFKGLFLGEEKKGYSRATTVQKCLRAGGKHNDLENVGMTSRHHTFFEMLGNFSFGDYFKEEATVFAWEFLTNILKLPHEKLWVTVFKDDDEAAGLWEKKVGVKGDRIVRLGEEDNFWSMGDTGPCGPCSEILIDQGSDIGCGRPECAVGCSCDRFLEIWNLVFMQYNRDVSGKLTPLPSPSIDTGMGLERLASVIQGVKSDYDIDLFREIISSIEDISGKKYRKDERDDFSIRVIADHGRAVAFLLAESLLPSNEGRGYVLRRIMRRAARHGKKLGIKGAFLLRVCERVSELMADTYPELDAAKGLMKKVIGGEEERFTEALDRGLGILDEILSKLREEGKNEIPGSLAFKLYDTYGFPIDITSDVAREEGFSIDIEGFEKEMDGQKNRARDAQKSSGGEDSLNIEPFKDKIKTSFVGYTEDACTSRVLAIMSEGRWIDEAEAGNEAGIIVEKTPFYGESGGQVGDRGIITGGNLKINVKDTKKLPGDIIIHNGTIENGKVCIGDTVRLAPDACLRTATRLNHTATHLLQSVLRKRLGNHVKQAGSFVNPNRLRFDFTHFSALTKEDLLAVEEEVNRLVRQDIEVATEILPIDEALGRGAIAFFDEKYGDTVRLVSIDDVSRELCGGLHAERTGQIGLFRISGESAVAAGVRRIEAITGSGAYMSVKEEEAILDDISLMLKTGKSALRDKIEKVLQRQKGLEAELSAVKDRLKRLEIRSLIKTVKDVNGFKVLATRVETKDANELRDWADKLKEKIGSGIVVLGSRNNEKALLLVAVTNDLTDRLHAGKIVAALAGGINGKGGGRADMAQAGGNAPEGLEKVLENAWEVVRLSVDGTLAENKTRKGGN